MVQRTDDSQPDRSRHLARAADDDDDRLGEAIEAYLALAEQDQAPDLEEFVARHDDMKDDLRAAMEGLELVHGLVGRGSARRPRAGDRAGARPIGWSRATGSPATGSCASWAAAGWGRSTRRCTSGSTARWR